MVDLLTKNINNRLKDYKVLGFNFLEADVMGKKSGKNWFLKNEDDDIWSFNGLEHFSFDQSVSSFPRPLKLRENKDRIERGFKDIRLKRVCEKQYKY